jgi:hypothetical protein
MTSHSSCGIEEEVSAPNNSDSIRCTDRWGGNLAAASFVIAALCVSGSLALLVIDYIGDGVFGFSILAVVSAVALWLVVGFPMLEHKKPIVFLPVMAVTSIAYLWAIERLTGGSGWFLSLALPIALAAIALFGLTVFICHRSTRQGPNIAAIVILGCTAVCVVVDNVISLNDVGTLRLGWSAIVAAAAVPTAILFFGLEMRLRSRWPGPKAP